MRNATRKVALTAHVLIGLHHCSESLEGPLKVLTATAKARSVKYYLFLENALLLRMLTSFIDLSSYLERAVSRLTDPYEVAIVTYALTLANSPAKESAFNGLHKIKRESGKFEF